MQSKPNNHQFKYGELPSESVNLAWVETPQIQPTDVKVDNFGTLSEESTNEVIVRKYWAALDGTLSYGEPIETKEFDVTDITEDGSPLFYKAYTRFYHLDLNKYIDGSVYTGHSISIRSSDGEQYKYKYRIILEVPAEYESSDDDEIPYKVLVQTESDAPFLIKYDKCDISKCAQVQSFEETLYPYPIFSRTDSILDVYPSGSNNYYIEDLSTGDLGYRVHVRAEAIVDNRNYEYFQWRVVGEASTLAVPQPNDILTPSSSYSVPLINYNNTTGVSYTSNVNVNIATANKKIKKVRAAIINDESSIAPRYHLFKVLESISSNVVIDLEFINPLAPSSANKDSSQYWRISQSTITNQGVTGLALNYDILIYVQQSGTLPYNKVLHEWAMIPNKGIIFLLSPNVNVASGWGFELSNLTGSSRELQPIWSIVEAVGSYYPDLMNLSEFKLFNDANIKRIENKLADRDLIKSLTINDQTVAGVINNHLYVSTIAEDSLILGRLNSDGSPASGYDGTWPLYMLDSSSGVISTLKYTNGTAPKIQMEAAQRLYDIIIYLSSSMADESEFLPSVDILTSYTKSNVIKFPTPWIDSWVIGSGALSMAEIDSDPTLVSDRGVIKRRLAPIPIKEIAKRYFYETYGDEYKDWVVSECHLEISNPNVKLCEDLNDDSIPWVYTDTYGGKPFLEGIGYPNGYFLYEPGFNRPYERDELLLLGWERKEQEELVTNPHGEWTPPEWVDPKKVWHDPVVISTPTTKTEIERQGKWKCGWTLENLMQKLDWSASGKATEESVGQEVSISKEAYIQSFTCKSLDAESKRSTAYAWQYLPNGEGILKIGSQGAKVRYWQDLLKKLGYYTGPVDGVYGQSMYDAVYKFQVDHEEILEDGRIGPETASRITFSAGTQAGEWYGWASTWNLLPERSGVFGRRTNPYDQVYNHNPLSDYVCVTLKSPQDVKNIKIKGAMQGGKTCKVTRITAWNGSNRVVDDSTQRTLSNDVLSIPISSTTQVDKIYIHILQDTPYMSVFTDGANYPSYHWGMEYIDIIAVSGTGEKTIPVTRTGSVYLLPGDSTTVSLPNKDTSVSSGIISWETAELKSGQGYLMLNVALGLLTITASGSSSGSIWGPEQVDWVAPSQGIKKYDAVLPVLPSAWFGKANMVIKVVSGTHSSVKIGLYDTSQNKWLGNSISDTLYMQNFTNIKVGIQGGETITQGGETTTIPGYWETVSSGYWKPGFWTPMTETRRWTTLGIEGPPAQITSCDPPIIKIAIKPYWLRFYNGRRNIRLLPPEPNLKSTDPWFPRISYAEWNQVITMPYDNLYDWMSYYPGASITAHYCVPEDNHYIERYRALASGDQCEIVGTYEIKLKHTPIFVGESTSGMMDIAIFAGTGQIASGDILSINKDGVVRISQDTTSMSSVTATYSYKKKSRDIRGLNLNPYPGHYTTIDNITVNGMNLIGNTIYVYLLPKYCTYNGSIISDSLTNNTLRWTKNKKIFECGSSLYNPLAFLVGVVSLAMPIEYKDIIILDSRKRGGGDTNSEVDGIWDQSFFSDKLYMESGVVVIELPETERSNEELIKRAIEKFIAAGTLYKIRWI